MSNQFVNLMVIVLTKPVLDRSINPKHIIVSLTMFFVLNYFAMLNVKQSLNFSKHQLKFSCLLFSLKNSVLMNLITMYLIFLRYF